MLDLLARRQMEGTAAHPGAAEPDFDRTLYRFRVACLLLALVACLPALIQLEFIWRQSDYFGHGYLIPLTAILLAYSRRDALNEALRTGESGRLGVIAVLAASAIAAVTVLARNPFSAGIGIPLLLSAATYAIAGAGLLRRALPSLLFLLLMVPPPGALQDWMLIGLKSAVVHFSVGFLQLLGFSVASIGNRIFVPQGELLVADACSGLTSIVTLAPLAAVVAYFLSHGIWRRALILLATVPIAMLGNIARVIITVVLVSEFGLGYAEGLVHDSFGLATFVLGTGVLLGLARLLR
jgi:exosortase